MEDNNKEYFFRVISNQIRFGCGYRTIEGKRQFFAWHGYPDRNSYYITTSEISESEFDEINSHCLQNKQSVKFSINSAFFIEMCYNRCKKIIKSNKKACT